MSGKHLIIGLVTCLVARLTAVGQVPSFVPYQGRVVVNGTNFDGVGQFKFAVVNPAGNVCYWANDGSPGIEPVNAVSLNVSRGLFALRLGDTNLEHMVALPASVFTNSDLRLRVWFNPGSGFEQLSPDHVIGSVAYAMMSARVEEGAIKPGMLAPETVALFVPIAGGAMSGALTNEFGFYGNGVGITNIQPGAYQETDPLFAGSVAAGITGIQTGQWSIAYLWGNHATSGYLRAVSNLSDLANIAEARINLGLGSLAVQDATNITVTGGSIANVSMSVKSNQFSVGSSQLVVLNGNVGIGTNTPASRLEVVGGTAAGEYIIRIYSGTNPIAWGKKK